MRPGFTPVERHANVICHNAACSMQDACTSICKINMEICRDRQQKPTTTN